MKSVLSILGVVLVAIGMSAVVATDLLAAGFGIAVDSAASRAYVVATATRDIAMGCWLLALVRLDAGRRTLAASVLAIAIVAVGDAVNVLTHSGGRVPLAIIGHLGGLVVLVSLGAWLWRTGSE
ncbi:MAG: DUF4267 domain-containing protein [Thermoguttaceae bacterium]